MHRRDAGETARDPPKSICAPGSLPATSLTAGPVRTTSPKTMFFYEENARHLVV